jgi:hypothetical protein
MQAQLAPPSFKNEQQLVIAWAKAAELGLSPLQAVEGMTIINNRVGIMGDLALAMVEASGLFEQKRVEYSGEGDSLECKVTLQRKGREPQTYSFSVREARAAGIYERSATWKGYPRRMCYYRALGFGLRDEFSDVLKGVKTVEELQDYLIEEPRQERPVCASNTAGAIRSARNSVGKGKVAADDKSAQDGQEQPLSATDASNGSSEEPSALSSQSAQPDPSTGINSKSLLHKVRLRLNGAQISEREFLDVLKFSRLPEAQDLSALDQVPDRILSMALEGWSTVAEIAHELRGRKTEGK